MTRARGVVGHVLFSPVVIGGLKANEHAVGLAPLAVLPKTQRQGIGDRLVRAGLEICRQRRFAAAIVLGDPAYYARFGFGPARRFGLSSEYDAPDDSFMAIELRPGRLGQRERHLPLRRRVPRFVMQATSKMSVGAEFFAPEHQQPQPWARLAEWLAAEGHVLALDPPPRQFTGGFGNLNYLVVLDGKEAVLRRPPAGPLPPGGNDMGREYRVLSRLWRAFPLAPRGLLFSDDAGLLGAPFFIMEYRAGVVIRDTLPPTVAARTAELSEKLIGILAEFHAVDPKAVDLDTLGNPEGFLKRTVDGWIKRCAVASADVYPDKGPHPAAREVGAWLAGQTPPAGGVSLLHNDYKLNNIIWDAAAATGGPLAPIAVLDWDMCTRGDPLFDLATLVSYWIEPGDPAAMHEMGQMPTALTPGWLDRRQIVALYARKTGRDVTQFHFYRVLTAFKLYIIFLQIYARYCRGTTTDPRIKSLGPTADGLVTFAREIMQGRAF